MQGRNCLECGSDISKRYGNARYCEKCSLNRAKETRNTKRKTFRTISLDMDTMAMVEKYAAGLDMPAGASFSVTELIRCALIAFLAAAQKEQSR